MTKHTYWTCDGCDKQLKEEPVRVTLTIAGTMTDRNMTYDLCGSCLHKVNAAMWPDWWARPEEPKYERA